jgi:hypothetical protein
MVRITNWTIILDWSDGQTTILEDMPPELYQQIQAIVDKKEQEARDESSN